MKREVLNFTEVHKYVDNALKLYFSGNHTKVRRFQEELNKIVINALIEVNFKKEVDGLFEDNDLDLYLDDKNENEFKLKYPFLGKKKSLQELKTSLTLIKNSKNLPIEDNLKSKRIFQGLENKGAVVDYLDYVDQEQYHSYIEQVRYYREGGLVSGDYFQCGWDKALELVEAKLEGLEVTYNKILPLYNSIAEKQSKGNVAKLLSNKSILTITGGISLNEIVSDLYDIRDLYDSILNFREKGETFDESKWGVFKKFFPVFQANNTSYEFKFPKQTVLLHPIISEFNNDSFFSLGKAGTGISIKYNGQKTLQSLIRKSSLERFQGKACDISDLIRITVEYGTLDSYNNLVKSLEKQFKANKIDYIEENFDVEPSFFISSKRNIVVSIDSVKRIGEIKIVEKNASEAKVLCDKLYELFREMKPEKESNLREYLDVNNPLNESALNKVSSKLKILEKNKNLKEYIRQIRIIQPDFDFKIPSLEELKKQEKFNDFVDRLQLIEQNMHLIAFAKADREYQVKVFPEIKKVNEKLIKKGKGVDLKKVLGEVLYNSLDKSVKGQSKMIKQ